jgi:hypothetical protein
MSLSALQLERHWLQHIFYRLFTCLFENQVNLMSLVKCGPIPLLFLFFSVLLLLLLLLSINHNPVLAIFLEKRKFKAS